jgi:hypothetical protein
MRKTMIALAAAFSVCTATMTSGTPAAFARGGGSFGGGTHALVGAALEATDLRWAAVTAGILEAASAILAAAFGTGASVNLDLASWIRERVLLRLRLWRLFGAPS